MERKLYKWIMICGGSLTFLLWIGAAILCFNTDQLPVSPWLSLLITGIIALPVASTMIAVGIKWHDIYSFNKRIQEQISKLESQEELDSESSEKSATNNDKKDINGVESSGEEEIAPHPEDESSQLQVKNEELQKKIDELNKQISNIQDQNNDLEEKLNQSEMSNEQLLNRIEPKWSKEMYELYGKQWNDFFDNVGIEIESTQKAEFLLLLWNIASQTMDFLAVSNNDPNTLRINESITNAIIEGKKLSEVEHKAFFEDPNTVEKKALAVFNYFKSQVAGDQEIQVSAFGYDIQIPNKTSKTQ